ncbi:MAG: copper amine oxidase N-terminal domain-containing protein [Peptoniphilus sp.]
MKKSFKSFAILTVFLAALNMNIFAAGKLPKEASDTKVNISINDVMQNIPEDMGRAYIDKNTDRVMVPARYISENLGSTIRFSVSKDNKQGIFIGGIYNVIQLEIGSNVATISSTDGKESNTKELDAPAILYDGRTYVPIRFISEAMGMEVDWDNNTVYIKGITEGGKKQREDLKKNSLVKDSSVVEQDKKDNSLSSQETKKDSDDIKIKGSILN